MRIVFFGTPDFSVPSLKQLVQESYNVVAVVTAIDKPAGRGLQIQSSAIKETARSLGIPVLQPKNLKSSTFIEELSTYNADIQIVIAFRMLPETVWNMPRFGTYNLHASLLPDYRGAAPINWAIINGEKKTGLTTFKLKHEIDTGDIILQKEILIENDMTAGELHDQMMIDGAVIVLDTLRRIETGNEKPLPQDLSIRNQKKAPKLKKSDCKIDWYEDADKIHNFVRGLSPYPGAWSKWEEKTLKVRKVEKSPQIRLNPGELFTKDKKLFVGTSDCALELIEIQLEGKKNMPVEDFLRGVKSIPKKLGN